MSKKQIQMLAERRNRRIRLMIEVARDAAINGEPSRDELRAMLAQAVRNTADPSASKPKAKPRYRSHRRSSGARPVYREPASSGPSFD